MTRGLAKANAYYNKKQAWDDWHWLADYAVRHGKGHAVVKFTPVEGAGYRKVDKAIVGLKAELGITVPLCEFRKQHA